MFTMSPEENDCFNTNFWGNRVMSRDNYDEISRQIRERYLFATQEEIKELDRLQKRVDDLRKTGRSTSEIYWEDRKRLNADLNAYDNSWNRRRGHGERQSKGSTVEEKRTTVSSGTERTVSPVVSGEKEQPVVSVQKSSEVASVNAEEIKSKTGLSMGSVLLGFCAFAATAVASKVLQVVIDKTANNNIANRVSSRGREPNQ